MVEIQVQAQALGDPTRHAIFRHIADADAPVAIRDLTDAFALNHTTIREHLAKLVDAGLVDHFTETPSGRGRPRRRFRVDPTADGRWGVEGPYERLSGFLLTILETGETPEEVGRDAGRRAGLDQEPSTDPILGIVDYMSRNGFDPHVEPRDDGGVDVVLHSCPFATGAAAAPTIVCGLHRGLAEGVAQAVGGVAVEDLVPTDPHHARCRLRCRPTGAELHGNDRVTRSEAGTARR